MPLQLRLRKVDPDSCHWPGLRDTNDMNRAGSGIGVKLPPPAFSAVKSGGALKDTKMGSGTRNAPSRQPRAKKRTWVNEAPLLFLSALPTDFRTSILPSLKCDPVKRCTPQEQTPAGFRTMRFHLIDRILEV